MAKKQLVSNSQIPKQKATTLTSKNTTPFIISFKYPLKKGYTFLELEKKHMKELQKFLDKISNMTYQQVDESFGRVPDKQDIYNGTKVYHYKVSKGFRIHGILEGGRFKVIRLDPNHDLH